MSDEITEVSKARLTALEGVNQLKEALWNDPTYGPQIKEMVKAKFPQANIPEVDATRAARKVESEALEKIAAKEKAIEDRIAAFEKAQADKETEYKTRKEEKAFESEVESVKKKYQLTAEGMEKVFARMKEKNNPDVESAAAWVTDHEAKAPVQENTFAPQTMDMYGANSGADEWRELNTDPRKYGDKIITEMANDFRNGNFGKYKEFGGNL